MSRRVSVSLLSLLHVGWNQSTTWWRITDWGENFLLNANSPSQGGPDAAGHLTTIGIHLAQGTSSGFHRWRVSLESFDPNFNTVAPFRLATAALLQTRPDCSHLDVWLHKKVDFIKKTEAGFAAFAASDLNQQELPDLPHQPRLSPTASSGQNATSYWGNASKNHCFTTAVVE